VFGPLWLLLRRRLPREPVVLSRRLWKLVLGLAAMPLCALIAVVLLTFRRYDSIEVNTVAMYQGMVVLPFVFLTSLVLLFAILILADHERLEQANRLAGLREVYYQGLRQQETQVRRLRHDLRNHLTAVRGFLEQGDEQGAIGYLDFTGNLDVCIAIRLAFQKNGKVFVRSGAGIVADSVPEKEYQECINKAQAVVSALELAQKEKDL